MRVLGLVFLTVFTVGCRRTTPQEASQRSGSRTVALRDASHAYIRVEPAGPPSEQIGRSLVARISFDERHVARIGAPVQGRVAKVAVVTGDSVKQGDMLLTLHAPDIATAQAQVTQARNARELAERTATRAATLVREGAGTEAERQNTELALAQAKNEEQRAVAALAALGGAHGSAEYALRAPLSGTVVERHVTVGSQVHVDQEKPLLTIADLENVWVLVDVYEHDRERIHVGDQAFVSVTTQPGKRYQGKLTYISNTLDPQTQAAQARVELPNPDRKLLPGMFASVELHGAGVGVSEIASSALVSRRDQFFVFVKNADGSFTEREIKIGEQHGEHSVVTSGLKPGEAVVVEGAILLDAELNETR